MFLTDQIAQLRWLADAVDVCFDQCEYGLNYRKPTQLLASSRVFERVSARCSHGREAHPSMTGKDEDGAFQTTAQSRHPSELCEILAACIINVITISPRVGEQAGALATRTST